MTITNERLDDLIFRFDAVDNSTAANALRELKALRERYRWIPVTERLPGKPPTRDVIAVARGESPLRVPASAVQSPDFTHWREIDMPEGV